MSTIVGMTPAQAAPADDRLQKTARQLEGLFVEQLFKAMRTTVSHDGMIDGGAGEELFTGMLDQHMAELMPSQWNHGMASSLVRQLRPESPK